MTYPPIAARLRAEPGWRAVWLQVPLQPANEDVTRVLVKVIHVAEWGVLYDGRLWPLDETGKPIPQGQLDGVHVPGGMSDEQLMVECRDRLQVTVDAIKSNQGEREP